MSSWPTALEVLEQAALELGLLQQAGDIGADPFSTTDPNINQLVALLTKAGRELVDEAPWTHLRQEYSILTESAADADSMGHHTNGVFPLPPDWRDMVDQSGWNRTTRLPMQGPLSEQEWQFLASRLTGVVWTVLFRPMQGLLFLYPPKDTPGGQSLTFAYKSGWWCQNVSGKIVAPAESASADSSIWQPDTEYNFGAIKAYAGPGSPFINAFYRCVQRGRSGAVGPDPAYATSPYVPTMTGPLSDGKAVWNFLGFGRGVDDPSGTITTNIYDFGTHDAPDSVSDVLLFDVSLLVAKLKLLWLRAKGFDSSDAERDYTQSLERIVSNDQAAPKLNLGRPGMVVDRLLGAQNYPITGYGS